MARGIFSVEDDALQAEMPAGATWDWTRNEANQLALDNNDTITSASWALEQGLVAGAIVPTSTSSTIFITAPATPRDTPYRCTLTYTTAEGRVTPRAFFMYVRDPVLFT